MEAQRSPGKPGVTAGTTPRQLPVWSCPQHPGTMPRSWPAPHQVQRGAAAQVLHDDPQLRALGPERRLSAQAASTSPSPGHTLPGRDPSLGPPGRGSSSLARPRPRPRHACDRSPADRPTECSEQWQNCPATPPGTRGGRPTSPHLASTPQAPRAPESSPQGFTRAIPRACPSPRVTRSVQTLVQTPFTPCPSQSPV